MPLTFVSGGWMNALTKVSGTHNMYHGHPALSTTGRHFNAYYFRTSDQHELDLVLELDGELWAIEVKLTTSPSPDDMRRLDKAADMIGATRRFLVSQVAKASGDGVRGSGELAAVLGHLKT